MQGQRCRQRYRDCAQETGRLNTARVRWLSHGGLCLHGARGIARRLLPSDTDEQPTPHDMVRSHPCLGSSIAGESQKPLL